MARKTANIARTSAYFSAEAVPDDDFPRGLAFALPISLALWALLIWALIHFAPPCSGKSTIDGRDLCAHGRIHDEHPKPLKLNGGVLESGGKWADFNSPENGER